MRAEAVWGDSHDADGEAATLDEQRAAAWAIGVFPSGGGPGKIARIDKIQPRGLADFGGLNERSRLSARARCHLIVGVKRRDMPGNIARQNPLEIA